MFFVLNKEKIYAYLVSIVTVMLLFCVASSVNNTSKGSTVQTVSTNQEQNQKLLPIYQVETKEKNVSLTMNCAW